MDRPLDDQPDQAIALRARAVRGHVEQYQPRRGRSDFDEFPSAEDIERFSGVTVTCQGCGAELMDDVAICWRCRRAVGHYGEIVGRSRRRLWPVMIAVGLAAVLLLTLVL